MRKLFNTSLLLLMGLVCSIFVACKDDDPKNDEDNATLEGVWVSEQMPLYDDSGDWITGDVVAYMWYKPDGTFIEADCIKEYGKEWIELSENGTWSVEDDVLTQTTNFDDDDYFDTEVLKFLIKGKSLHVTYDVDGVETTSVLKRSTEEVMQNIINAKKNPK